MTVECWHFLPDNGHMQFSGQQVKVGETYRIDEAPILCVRGFHGSRRALDALQYAPGALCCRVEIGGEIVEEADKLCGQSRRVLWMIDATKVLHLFAVDMAEEALRQHQVTAPASWQAIACKRRWLDGECSDADLEAARQAACAAIWAAAGAKAWVAAREAAREAARQAACAAVWAKAWVAAREAAWAVARAAAGEAAWETAREAVREAARAAAREAARVAARAVARAAAGEAARETAREAAWETAREAAWEAAWETARVAARAVAREAAGEAQNTDLERRLFDQYESSK